MSQKASKRANESSPISPHAVNTVSNDENASFNIENTKIDLSLINHNDNNRFPSSLKPFFDSFKEELLIEFERKHYLLI